MGQRYEDGGAGSGAPERSLWVDGPGRQRMPDPVRESAVRAVLIVAVTLTDATVAFFLTITGSWLAFPLVLTGIAGTVVATWAVLDVVITRQMWNQRYGVVSEPSSTARVAPRERRRADGQARPAWRIRERGEAAGAAWPAPTADGRYRTGTGRG
ncbi:hypothetical protein ACFWCB_33740 [Streptomyces sp. NPDC060048]|uniref:hypothetical protein n=1 Tax=unclassified Streptomyces TaxID=2593676 RepID=UPI0036B3577C